MKYFAGRTNEALAIRLQWHTLVILIPFHFLFFCYFTLVFLIRILTLPGQAAQLAYMMEDRLMDATDEIDKEKALKDVVEATTKEKAYMAKNAKARAQEVERAWAQADK